jgi:hypothetical protein
MFMFGGRVPQAEDAGDALELNDMYRFSFETESWTAIEQKGDVPTARSFHLLTDSSDGKSFYCFGGCSVAGRMNDLH